MNRYCDMDKLAQAVCEDMTLTEEEANKFIHLLWSQSATDVAKVQHGCWMYGETSNPFVVEVYCPLCGKPALYPNEEEDDSTRPLETDFCPHCGTVMDATCADPSWPFYNMSLKQKLKKE